MSRLLALVSCIFLLCWQHGICLTSLCPGPSIPFLDSCYQFVLHRVDFWRARSTCLACGGHLANVSHEDTLAFLKHHMNESSKWWIHHNAKGANTIKNKSSMIIPCMILSKSANNIGVQEASCIQENNFICRTDGKNCFQETQHSSVTFRRGHDLQSRHHLKRRKRSSGQDVDIPDINYIAQQLLTIQIVGGSNVTDLLIYLTSMLQDEEGTNITRLNEEVSLLHQLSDRILNQDLRTSVYFTDLSNVVYFGVNSILQSLFTSCSEIQWTLEERQLLSNSCLAILQALQLSTLSSMSVDGSGMLVQTPMFSLQISSVNSSKLGQTVLSFPNPTKQSVAHFVLPVQSALQSVVKSYPEINVQMMSFAENPFLSSSGVNISGTVASFNLIGGMQELNVKNLQDHFQIFLPRSPFLHNTTQIQTAGDKALRLSLMVTPPGSTLVIIVTVNKGIPLLLYHGLKNVILALKTQGSNTDSYTWILPPELFSNPTSLQTFLVSPNNSLGIQTLQLRVSSFTSLCAFMDPNTMKWSSDGCKVGPWTSLEQAQCLCNHLSIFGSSFLVLPVQIDVTRTAEYFSQISQNPVIVVLLACFYACYILVVLWARRMDLRDQVQSRVIVPNDNDSCALYRYRITVCTGHRRGSSTSAKVSLSLAGSDCQYGPVLLSDNRNSLFKNGSIDVFLLTTPFPLGELLSITLTHDGTGTHKSWYVTQVTAQDVQLKKSWHFLCNAWLSVPPKGESLTRSFKAANEQELTSFRNIFVKKTLRGLRDEHIWISVLNHPARSVFTRVQRVSCCMCLLLCTIVINLMFWELPQVSYPVLIQVGSFSLTWKDIMIGFESALLMFPVNLLIIYIFRNTRPKVNGASKTKTKKGSKEPLNEYKKNTPFRSLCLDSVLKDLERTMQTLSQASRNSIQEPEMKPECGRDVSFLLQHISHMLQKQPPLGTSVTSVPLAQLPSDELHALFCAHYVSRKLRRVFQDLQDLGGHDFQDKGQYDECVEKLQALLHTLDRSVPPLPQQRSPPKQHAQHRRLPWWFLLIGWSLLISISVVSTYFTMMYGFLYGKQSSIRWIISMTLSLFQSIFILQPLKVIGFAIFFALVLKKVEDEEELDGELLGADGFISGYQACDETIF